MGQAHPRPILRVANVVWCRAAENGAYTIGVCFQKNLVYRDYIDLTQPIREAEERRQPPAAAGPQDH